MDAVTYSELRENLKTYMDKVYLDHDPLIITRKNNENLILISLSEYNSLLETSYLLKMEANAAHLRRSLEQAAAGQVTDGNCSLMNKLFTDEAWKDYLYWFENDKKQLRRINELIRKSSVRLSKGKANQNH
jgi:antitoxin YefM